jgi:hypothetical protein
MKIKKDPEPGQILIELKYDKEMCDHQAAELLKVLLVFSNEQIKQLHKAKLTNCYNELVERLNKLKKGKQL